ncbi:oligosaccharyltransferase gamma subunit [Schizosaccharomyces japonicus yFS275]|uniref:Oligosaccharyltransferase gamma subunit n=1 Tax=Schizosaccharomyces japonicus (strain yFS275 / FY16936) TaxID=402676 RepID=B6K3Y6_SCHJY|nr:oligosaccharyltransferase gamma subunit [Schizosaccharomyces japonicus yFS275]EEB08193.1 oligosaccharyltransferase gamma subunit [Schizosaccharomyces japonicus yFS275]
MILSKLLTWLAFFITFCAAKPDVFSMVNNAGLIEVTDSTFSKVITGSQDYVVVALLTATQGIDCETCTKVDPEFRVLAKSHRKAFPNDKELVFVHADFQDNKNTFRGYNIRSIPNFWVFEPHTNAPHELKLMGDLSAEYLSESIASLVGKLIPIYRPHDYSKDVMSLVSLLIVVAFVTYYRKALLRLVHSRKLWAAISIVSVITFSSGHMFNRIRGTQYVQHNQDGSVSWMAGGQMNQFGAETQVVSLLYFVLSLSVISLAYSAPCIRGAKSQTIFVIAWLTIQVFLYSYLAYIFREKNGYYPFKLLL